MKPMKSDPTLAEFRRFVDANFPGGCSHMSDSQLSSLRDLVEPGRSPKVVHGLIAEIDTLLRSDDQALEKWMSASAATGIKFDSGAEARSYLHQFRALLAAGQDMDLR
jgi:hypothetical protein